MYLAKRMYCVLALFAFVAIATPAYATFQCVDEIELDVQFENNCDGTITAHFYYDNPNDEWCYFDFFHWQWECEPCPDIWIPVSPLNKMIPNPEDQGQVTLFTAGYHYSHSVTFPANGVPRTWRVKYPLWAPAEYATADPVQAAQECPVIPEVDCMEAIPGDGYRAHFRVKNWNTLPIHIPTGSHNKFVGIGDDQGQPTNFPAWPAEISYTLEWDGSATRWSITNCGSTYTAPEAPDYLDVDFFDEPANRCENVPINPEVTCTYDNQDGTLTAWFGYESFRPGNSHIAIDEIQGGANEINPDVPSQSVVGQPEWFTNGQYDGVMSVSWNAAESDEMTWMLFWGEFNWQSIASAHAPDGEICKQCAQITPTACISQSLQGNQSGYLTAKFGYANDNNFTIDIPAGPLNFVTGGNNAPNPSLTTSFVAGGQDPMTDPGFSVEFNDADSVTWEVAGESETADFSTPLCEPNALPSCEIVGQTGLNCGGVDTATSLTAQGTDPEGRAVSYQWQVQCGDDGVNSTYLVSGVDDEQLDLTLLDPGAGQEVPVGACKVRLIVSDDFGSSQCEVDITSSACDLDCANAPYPQGEQPQNVNDECGVCRPHDDPEANSTCLDCAGIPNGLSVEDTNGMCCLETELDQCGVCNGNNDTCLDCTDADISATQFTMDGTSDAQRALAVSSSRKLRRAANGAGKRSAKKLAKELIAQANAIYNESWTISWSFPSVVSNCLNTELCVSVSNVSEVEKYTTNAAGLRDIVSQAVTRLRKVTGKKKNGKKLLTQADELYSQALTAAEGIPAEVSACNTDA